MLSLTGHLYHESHECLAINFDKSRVIRPFVTFVIETEFVERATLCYNLANEADEERRTMKEAVVTYPEGVPHSLLDRTSLEGSI